MKEVTVVSYDDLFMATENRHVVADGTVTIGYNGTEAELDLTDKNREELEQVLMPYLKAGRRPERGHRSGMRPGTQLRPGIRGEKAAMRAWADAQVRLHPELARDYDYITPGSRAKMKVNPKARASYYHKDRLVQDWAAHLRRQGQDVPAWASGR